MSERTLHSDKFNTITLQKVELPNGIIIENYPQFISPDVSMVFAVTRDKKAILIQEYRHAAGKVLTGLPAGLNVDHEDPKELAKHELLEETGYKAPKLEKLVVLLEYATKLPHRVHIFFAKDAVKVSKQSLEDTEDLDVILVPLGKLKK